MSERLLRPAEAADLLAVSRPTILRLCRDEALPHRILTVGPQGRRIVRFVASELTDWIAGRRERQVKANLDGNRYRRGVA